MRLTYAQTVSVIVTTYGDSSDLSRAIESVLGQTYEDIELLVVDDNDPNSPSREKTEKVMEAYVGNPRVVYLQHERNLNGAAARNTGIENAVGGYITFLDNDDFMLPDRVAAAVEALKTTPDFGAVFCGVACYQGMALMSVVLPEQESLNQAALLANDGLIGTGSNLFFRTEAVHRVGMFDTSFRRHQDLEYAMRYFRAGRALSIPEIQLVKTVGKTDNSLGYETALEVKRQFHAKFENDIEHLDVHERALYEANVCNVLVDACIKSGDKASARRVSAHMKEELQKAGITRSLLSKVKFSVRLNAPGVYGALSKAFGFIPQGRREKAIGPKRLQQIEAALNV